MPQWPLGAPAPLSGISTLSEMNPAPHPQPCSQRPGVSGDPGGCVCGGDQVPGWVQGVMMEVVLDRNPFLLKCSPQGQENPPSGLAGHGQNRVTPRGSRGQV